MIHKAFALDLTEPSPLGLARRPRRVFGGAGLVSGQLVGGDGPPRAGGSFGWIEGDNSNRARGSADVRSRDANVCRCREPREMAAFVAVDMPRRGGSPARPAGSSVASRRAMRASVSAVMSICAPPRGVRGSLVENPREVLRGRPCAVRARAIATSSSGWQRREG
jgi:hypothetical protein